MSIQGQPFAGRIVTASYNVAQYTFCSSLPVIGTSDDRNEWTASVDGKYIEGRFASLEAAMQAALSTHASAERK